MIDWIRSFWYGLGGLNDLELLILKAIRSKIAHEAVLIWDAQISDINKVQRLPNNIESNFYSLSLKNGKPVKDLKKAFPNQKKELLIAKVKLKYDEIEIDVDVWAVHGFLFSLEFSDNPKHLVEKLGSYASNSKIEIACEITSDLLSTGL